VSNNPNERTAKDAIHEFADDAISVHHDEVIIHHQRPDGMDEFTLAVSKHGSRG
jgi:hypothetical protein